MRLIPKMSGVLKTFKEYTSDPKNKKKFDKFMKKFKKSAGTIGVAVVVACSMFLASCDQIDWKDTNGPVISIDTQDTMGATPSDTTAIDTGILTPGTIDDEESNTTSPNGTQQPSNTQTPSGSTTGTTTIDPTDKPSKPGNNTVESESATTAVPTTPTVSPVDLNNYFNQILPSFESAMTKYYDGKKISQTGRVANFEIKSILNDNSKVTIVATGNLTSNKGAVTGAIVFVEMPADADFETAFKDVKTNGANTGNVKAFVDACKKVCNNANVNQMNVVNGYTVVTNNADVVYFTTTGASKKNGNYDYKYYQVTKCEPTACEEVEKTLTVNGRLSVSELKQEIANEVDGVVNNYSITK